MIKKCFVILMFGKPFPWIDQFIDSVQHLEKYGWYWKIFTPYPIDSKGNVEIVPMNIDKFNSLVKKTCGVKSVIYITDQGIPSIHVTDFMVAYGKIFKDYLEEFDFWGMMGGPDILFGRLDHFLPDSNLDDCDIFTDDPGAINGCFTLFRNTEFFNNLFTLLPNWKDAFTLNFCPKCTGKGDNHILFGTDEYGMSELVKKNQGELIQFKHPKYYPIHGHDRLLNHKIELKEDGSLWELNRDINPPKWEHQRPFIGREIMYYHFSQTKQWPI